MQLQKRSPLPLCWVTQLYLTSSRTARRSTYHFPVRYASEASRRCTGHHCSCCGSPSVYSSFFTLHDIGRSPAPPVSPVYRFPFTWSERKALNEPLERRHQRRSSLRLTPLHPRSLSHTTIRCPASGGTREVFTVERKQSFASPLPIQRVYFISVSSSHLRTAPVRLARKHRPRAAPNRHSRRRPKCGCSAMPVPPAAHCPQAHYYCNICLQPSTLQPPIPSSSLITPVSSLSLTQKAATAVSLLTDGAWFFTSSASSSSQERESTGHPRFTPAQAQLVDFFRRVAPFLRLAGLKNASHQSQPLMVEPSSLSTRLNSLWNFGKEVKSQIERAQLTPMRVLRALPRIVHDPLPVKEVGTGTNRRGRPNRCAPLSHPTVFERLQLFESALDALRYATAVYGVAYEQGMLHSVRRAVLLFTHPIYQGLNYASTATQKEAVTRLLQLNSAAEKSIFASSSSPTAPELLAARYALDKGVLESHHSSYIICVDHAKKQLVVSFRGTSTLWDSVSCLKEGYLDVQVKLPGATTAEPLCCTETKIPRGFAQLTLSCAKEILYVIAGQVASMKEPYDLILTGHSLGAIQSTLFHVLCCGPHPSFSTGKTASSSKPLEKLPHLTDYVGSSVPFRSIQSFNFAPAPTLAREAAERIASWLSGEGKRWSCSTHEGASLHRMISFVHGDDIVPRAQPWSISALVTRHNQQDHTPHSGTPSTSSSSSCPSFLSPIERLRYAAATGMSMAPPTGSVPLYIPGEALFLPHRGRCGGVVSAPLTDPLRNDIGLLLQPETFSGSPVINVLRHHMPVMYLHCIHAEASFYANLLAERKARCARSMTQSSQG